MCSFCFKVRSSALQLTRRKVDDDLEEHTIGVLLGDVHKKESVTGEQCSKPFVVQKFGANCVLHWKYNDTAFM
jgi:hypothetical protein